MPTRRAPKIASLDFVHDLAASIPDEHLLCRLRGHRWEDYGRVSYSRKHKTFEEAVDCERCEANLVTIFRTDGEVLSRRIDYTPAEGYLQKGNGRIDARGRQMLQAQRLDRRRRQAATTRKRAKEAEKATAADGNVTPIRSAEAG